MKYVGNLWDQDKMRQRVESVIDVEDDLGVIFRTIYTVLPSTSSKQPPKTFIILPPEDSKSISHFTPATNSLAPDELQAHTGMFAAKTNDGYYALGLETSRIIREAINIGRGLVQDDEAAAAVDATAEGAMEDKITTAGPTESKESKEAKEWMERGSETPPVDNTNRSHHIAAPPSLIFAKVHSAMTTHVQDIGIPPLAAEEEDAVIQTRITNDERPLRRVVKKFHHYTSVAHTPVVSSSSSTSIEDAREAFLVEVASFQLTMKKSMMICDAETRQVEEYERERTRIEDEHGKLRGQIEQLKTALEHAQMERRRKIEYDAVTEKVNTLPSREELEKAIQDLENDMTAIRSEHDNQNRRIQAQKHALDGVISDLGALNLLGKDKSRQTSPAATPIPEGEPDAIMDNATDGIDSASAPDESGEIEERESGEEKDVDSQLSSLKHSNLDSSLSDIEDDIEMGEVAEIHKIKAKKKVREEELEEGEASDSSSALSDPPDD
ncbi:hypothetical protein HWV62_45222 [Athelia sp. TMB]|nr:hypothetical protein HWV62_45222 [Athelia sp. TMB]